jgi:hypothetical protein
MLNEACRRLVECYELAAIGRATPAQVAAAKRAVTKRAREEFAESGTDGLAEVGPGLLCQLRLEHLPGWEGMPPPTTYFAGTEEQRRRNEADRAALMRVQLGLLRDVAGNPFRRPSFDPAWRTPAVVRLAQEVYMDRVFDQMPLLADALQDVGCDDEQILSHCCGPGPHIRGCWVVDLALAKE